jgi:hypothetical protein
MENNVGMTEQSGGVSLPVGTGAKAAVDRA